MADGISDKDKFVASVHGLSTLRAKEERPAELSEAAKARQAYLAKVYGNSNASSMSVSEGKKKRRKKKVAGTAKPGAAAVRVFEEDNTGFKQADVVQLSDEEDAPVLANPEEAERLQRRAELERTGELQAAWVPADEPARPSGRAANGRSSGLDQSLLQQQADRHDSPDQSPPRRRAGRHSSPDQSPPRRRSGRHDSPDQSPPRRRAGRHSSSDQSPPRRGAGRHDSPDQSPPRRGAGRHDSPDQSPPRRGAGRHDSPDQSPPRRIAAQAATADPGPGPSGAHKRSAAEALPPAPAGGGKRSKHMSDGTTAGKVSGAQLALELRRKAAEEQERRALERSDVTGQGAATVLRDKITGKILTAEEYEEQLEKERKAKDKASKFETPEWGQGMAQRAAAEARRREMAEEAAKPFARRREDVDHLLRDRLRFGDPMAHLVKRRQPEQEVTLSPALQQQLKKGGFKIPQEVPPHSWLRRNIGPPLNRYSLRPGRHWDGVDRSNGFESEMWTIMTDRRSRAQMAQMWGQEDM